MSRGIQPHCGSWKRALLQRELRNKTLKACGWKCEMMSFIWKALQLITTCSKITWTSVKAGKAKALVKRRTSNEPNLVQPIRLMWITAFDPGPNCSYWFYSEYKSESQRKLSTNHTSGELPLFSEWALLHSMKAFFTRIKLFITNRDSSIGAFRRFIS